MASWRFPRVDVVGVCAPFRGVDDPFLLRWMIVQKGLAFRLDETLKNFEAVPQPLVPHSSTKEGDAMLDGGARVARNILQSLE
jgi:hypothetical protein